MEWTEVGKALIDYGLLGIAVLALSVYILKRDKSHREERSEWRKLSEEQFKKMVDVVDRNTSVVCELKGTMETIQKQMCA